MTAKQTRILRFAQASMIIAVGVFILIERLWFVHVIPKDFHPAATTAMAMAVFLFLIWIAILFIDTAKRRNSVIGYCIITASAYLTVIGLSLGLGESGCSAWMLAAPLLVIGIGKVWYDETLMHFRKPPLDDIWANPARWTLLFTGVWFDFLILAGLASYFKW